MEPLLPIPGFQGIDHDPLDPHPDVPTPLDMVLRLTRPDRERRVRRLSEMAWERYEDALRAHGEGKEITATCVLFSGGKDSATVAALFRPVLTHVIHADTGTGIQATRDFVADVARAWGLPLLMERGQDDYFDLVLGKVRTKSGEIVWPGGFPGPGAHGKPMYQRLKERALDRARHSLGIANSRTKRAVWIAGRRRTESAKRATVPHHEADGSVIWCSPIAVWHKADLLTLRLMRGDVPVNPVSEVLGMSGECGCLANAHPGERDAWFRSYPDEPFLARVRDVEAILAGPGYEHIPAHAKRWGWGAEFDDGAPRGDGGRLCGADCGPDPLLDLMDPLFRIDEMGAA